MMWIVKSVEVFLLVTEFKRQKMVTRLCMWWHQKRWRLLNWRLNWLHQLTAQMMAEVLLAASTGSIFLCCLDARVHARVVLAFWYSMCKQHLKTKKRPICTELSCGLHCITAALYPWVQVWKRGNSEGGKSQSWQGRQWCSSVTGKWFYSLCCLHVLACVLEKILAHCSHCFSGHCKCS